MKKQPIILKAAAVVMAAVMFAAGAEADMPLLNRLGAAEVVQAADESESFDTNQGKKVYTGKHFEITCSHEGDTDGFAMYLPEDGYSASIKALDNEKITKVELTNGFAGYDINNINLSSGTKSVANGVATFTDVNASVVELTATGHVQIKKVVVYYTIVDDVLYGDVNFDGKVDDADAKLVLGHISKETPFSSDAETNKKAEEMADIDGNRVLNILDVIGIMNKSAVKVTSVELNKSVLALLAGKEEYLFATITPSDATDQTVVWESSYPTIAKVDQNGKVTTISKGETTITATVGGKSATCTVYVF